LALVASALGESEAISPRQVRRGGKRKPAYERFFFGLAGRAACFRRFGVLGWLFPVASSHHLDRQMARSGLLSQQRGVTILLGPSSS
jgi:hypothetical protein